MLLPPSRSRRFERLLWQLDPWTEIILGVAGLFVLAAICGGANP